MRKNTKQGLTITASFAVGIAVGYLITKPIDDAKDFAAAVKVDDSLTLETDPYPDSLSNEFATTSLTATSARDEMSAALSEYSTMARRARCAEVLKHLTPENWRGMWEGFYNRDKNGFMHRTERSWFAQRAGEVVGKEAMLYFAKEQKLDSYSLGASKACLMGWVVKDVDRAFEWLETEIDPKYRDKIWRSAMDGIFGSTPDTAIGVFEQLPVNYRKKYTTNFMQNLVRSVGVEEADLLFEGMADRAKNNGELEGEYLVKIFSDLANYKFQHISNKGDSIKSAASWLSDHIGQPYVEKGVIRRVVSDYAAIDHRAALEWLDTTYSIHPDLQVLGYGYVVRQWTEKEGVNAVSDWLNNNMNHPQYDYLAREHIKIATKSGDTETAMKWINNISDEKMKADLLKSIFK